MLTNTYSKTSNIGLISIIFPTLFLLLLSFFITTPLEAQEGKAVQRIRTDRPDPEGTPTKVMASLYIVDLDDIDGASQTFTANVYLQLSWMDPRLATENGFSRTFNLKDVWRPRIQLINQQKLWTSRPEVVEVGPDGTVRYGQRFWGQFSYPFNLRDFPLDKHKLEIIAASVDYDTEELNIVVDKSETGMADILTVADWRIVSWDSFPSTYKPSPGARPVAGFVFQFEASRLVGYYIYKIILPLALVILMSWVIFWIKPVHIGTKVSVAATAMLTLIAYRFVIGDLLPRISYLTRMDIFIIGSSILVFLSLLESSVAAWLEDSGNESLALVLDFWSRWAFPMAFAVLVILTVFV